MRLVVLLALASALLVGCGLPEEFPGPTGVLYGLVTDAAGRPVPDAFVVGGVYDRPCAAADTTRRPPALATAVSDQAGRYRSTFVLDGSSGTTDGLCLSVDASRRERTGTAFTDRALGLREQPPFDSLRVDVQIPASVP